MKAEGQGLFSYMLKLFAKAHFCECGGKGDCAFLKAFVSHFLPNFDGDIDELLERINNFRREEMWCDASPIWARPQDGSIKMYPRGYLQVVGHAILLHL